VSEAYFSAVAESDGLEGPLSVEPGWIVFWPAAFVLTANADYCVDEFLPGFFGFGSSGGGWMFAFDLRNVSDQRRRVERRGRPCGAKSAAQGERARLNAAGVMASSSRPKTSRWVPRRSKAQARYACTGTSMARQEATIPSRTAAR
jgi:hypothetical protein